MEINFMHFCALDRQSNKRFVRTCRTLKWKNGVKYQMFVSNEKTGLSIKFSYQGIDVFVSLVTCIEFALSSYGKHTGNFLSNKQDYEVPFKCAQRREVKQQFSKIPSENF